MPATPRDDVFDKRAAVLRDDHDTLHRLVAAARNALDDAPDTPLAVETIEALYRSNNVHTYSEGLLMRLYQYPDRELHEVEHAKLDGLAGALWEDFQAGDVEASRERLEQYAAMLQDHLDTFDQALSRFFEDVGAVVK